MKKARFIVALAIILGCSTTANAQLGGLVKKAKKAVTEKVQEKVKETKPRCQEPGDASGNGESRTGKARV